jgi:uncharacterized repeat protein (TIGR04076 family)
LLLAKVKITVLKKTFNQDLADEYCKDEVNSCPVFTEGQEFVYELFGSGGIPENFCDHAWVDIYTLVFALGSNGSFPTWMKNENSIIGCCTDGIRPVVFKIERVSE